MTQVIPNINDFALMIHQINVSKGFWEAERNVGELFMLMVNEASECQEADRKGRWARIPEDSITPLEYSADEAKEFEATIKNTVEDELADIVIRLADTCGFLGLDLFEVDRDYDNQEIMEYRNVTMDNFSDRLLDVCAELIKLSNYLKGHDPRTAPSVEHKNVYLDHASELASVVYSKIVKIADDWDIDLKWHVHAKVAFNKTRAYKHGKKY